MSESNGRIWPKILLALLVPILVGLVGYGALKSDVQHVTEDVRTRAPREVVDAQYQALLRELQQINARLDRIERRP